MKTKRGVKWQRISRLGDPERLQQGALQTEKSPALQGHPRAFQAEGPIGAKVPCGEEHAVLRNREKAHVAGA